MSWLEVLAVIGIIGFVIYQQFAGQPLQDSRLVVLPAVVTVIGFFDLRGHHLGPVDLAWLTAGAAGSLLIGLAFGVIMRLEPRGGVLWAKMPLRGLWLWVGLVAWRVLIVALAARTGAHVAASATPLLFTLGLNRLGQAAVIARALRAAVGGLTGDTSAAPGPAPGGRPPDPPDGLTQREAEILSLIAQGLTNGEIAARLFLSNHTIKTHINRIFAKTGSRDRVAAIAYAQRHHIG